MEFKDYASLRLWVRSQIVRVFQVVPRRAVSLLARLFTPEYWLSLPSRVVAETWGMIVGTVLTFRFALHRAARIPFVRLTVVTIVLGILAIWGVFAVLAWLPSTEVAESEPEYEIRYLDQGKNWGPELITSDNPDDDYRQTFYYTPQGTSLLATGFRYAWFTHLEQSWSNKPFADPAHMRALGFQVDNVSTPKNPDHLPVGFAKHFAPEFSDDVLDITCAACHTGELLVNRNGRTVGIRIDGGQAMHAFTSTSLNQFGSALLASMIDTLIHPTKFRRFAMAVLQERYPAAAPHLYADMLKVTASLMQQAGSDAIHNRYPVAEGFGRTDAIGRIANRAFGADLDPANFAQGNAPVSYPAIWNAHHWDWVQYGASVSQPLARNVGESLGVGATLQLVDDYGRPLQESERFIAGTRIKDLRKIEDAIATLRSPQWPEDILGNIDQSKAQKGRDLFAMHCAHCHEPCLKTPPQVEIERPLLASETDPAAMLWQINAIPVEEVGTDPQAAINFVQRRITLEKTGLTRDKIIDKIRPIIEADYERRKAAFAKYHAQYPMTAPDPGDKDAYIQSYLAQISVRDTSIGAALNYVDTFIVDKSYKELGITDPALQAEYNGDGALDIPQAKMVYKARPLGGVWATAPYLHNGSVPTLYDLLSPANERPRKFFVRNRLDFDPVRVGLVSSPASDKGFWLDTTIPGNRNTGHEFRAGYREWSPDAPPSHGVIGPELRPEERMQIIEYLKIYKEEPKPCEMPKTAQAARGASQ